MKALLVVIESKTGRPVAARTASEYGGSSGLLGELHDVRRGLHGVNLVPLVDGVAEIFNVPAVDDDEALVLGVDAALLLDQVAHGLELRLVGCEDGDELVLGVGGGDSGRRAQRRHEDWLLGVLAGLVLEVEEITAVAGDCARGEGRGVRGARQERERERAQAAAVRCVL
eukprot:scaffold3038_cov69-Phaeocystis_antarctica.AAC.1